MSVRMSAPRPPIIGEKGSRVLFVRVEELCYGSLSPDLEDKWRPLVSLKQRV